MNLVVVIVDFIFSFLSVIGSVASTEMHDSPLHPDHGHAQDPQDPNV